MSVQAPQSVNCHCSDRSQHTPYHEAVVLAETALNTSYRFFDHGPAVALIALSKICPSDDQSERSAYERLAQKLESLKEQKENQQLNWGLQEVEIKGVHEQVNTLYKAYVNLFVRGYS
jgi:hypothetical protein